MFRGPVIDKIGIKKKICLIELNIKLMEMDLQIYLPVDVVHDVEEHWALPTCVENNAVNGNVPFSIIRMVLVDVTHPSRHAVIAFVDVKIFVPKLMEIMIRGQVILELIISIFL